MKLHLFYLQRLWEEAPLSWAIIRTIECELLQKQKYTAPILEIGCGDGLVSQLIFNNQKKSIDVGIDLDKEELRRALKTGIYKKLLPIDITNNHFKDRTFNTVFANGVLEHIPDLNKALSEIFRILKPNGILITTSPINSYSKLLFYSRVFSFLKLNFLARGYESMVNSTFVHIHLLSVSEWRKRLQTSGFTIKKITIYNSPHLILLHDLCLPFSLFTKLLKKLTDQMVLFSKLRKPLVKIIAPLIIDYINEDQSSGLKNRASILIIAQKK